MPTVKPAANFNAEADCEALKKSMKGFGTDEDAIVNILSRRNNDQRMQIAAKYKSMYGKDVVDKLKSEVGGNFQDLVVAMMTPVIDFVAQELHDAMAGLGTDESVLIEILCSLTNQGINLVKDAYQRKFGTTLEDDIKGDTSGTFRKILISLCTGQRDESANVNMGLVESDVQELIAAGIEQVGTDESVFNKVMAARSYNHLRKIFETYEAKTGTKFEQTINNEFSGDTKDALMSLVRCTSNSYIFYADLLHDALAGIGTKDKTLIRIVVFGGEFEHLEGAKQEYLKKYGKSLAEDVAADTSGDYKNMLVNLINGQ